MSWTDDLLTGAAELTDAIGAGTWDPDGNGGNVFHDAIPVEPDNAIGLTVYNLQADSMLADAVQPIQFWIRGDAAFVKTTADTLFDNLHGVVGLVVAGIHCPLVELHSDVNMGPDESGRHQRSVNYDFHAMRPTASRTD